MKPLIGFTMNYVSAFEEREIRFKPSQDHVISDLDYPSCIVNAGGIPIPISVIDDEGYMDSILDRIDGLVLTGGSDLSPQFYRQPYKKGLGSINPIRDSFEMKLVEKAIKKQMPIIGVCRGLQLLNVFFGGTLIQDIDENFKTVLKHDGYMGPKWGIAHNVKLDKNKVLYKCFGKEEIEVNSFHHQIIDTLGSGFEVAAMSEDGIIEGIVHTEYPFIVAVQWHPEMMADVYQEQLKLFQLLINFVNDNPPIKNKDVMAIN
ncbi:gamma-glutamyl-gamma-aminobutyrate hydrolase family protein [Peribacillus butanolivorans]|uniref:gamma-glutamyl-gamma-aminobutyrate hydrolase family protein n=1 Tax=Peribacillus butanolivorans TaxID=421767 RepID=UPI00207D04F3|nr:gamma-glutamyl-gamma-aminobutyrate hydrolase family protein [Peribacillus butanolivorans]MCO0600526.1 gamma-glutamyl-gamma-aminobutyrate hydrolase family protein [Peribacillus butanolivorans]